jgi:hypothetical protein
MAQSKDTGKSSGSEKGASRKEEKVSQSGKTEKGHSKK